MTTKIEFKERGILFSSEMVRAILAGRKTQTRRIIKPQPLEIWDECKPITTNAGIISWCFQNSKDPNLHGYIKCPYGKVGDRLWVKETFAYYPDAHHVIFKAREGEELKRNDIDLSGCWKSSYFMPKKFARIWLEITGIRVERVQNISEEDAQAEGCSPFCRPNRDSVEALMAAAMKPEKWTPYKAIFARVWEKLNAKRGHSWDKNSWVWVISFRKVTT